MKEPVLIIMAAGMGSRYGGLKQIDPVTDRGEIIMDFSLYDAMMAGFKKVIFVIKEEMKDDFYKLIENKSGKYLQTEYAFQKLSDIPEGYEIPEGREKPWGTAHAVLSCREKINGPFAVINADDYYGPGAFHAVYDFLSSEKEEADGDFCMVGYELSNTLTENGHVARGVCDISKNDYLRHIVERKKIMRVEGDICYSEDDGKTWMALPQDATVSMNFWGYTLRMMEELEKGFPEFLKENISEDPLKGEYLLPSVTGKLIHEGKAAVKVLDSSDKWYGVTYKEDKPGVMAALQALKDKGIYPEILFSC